MRETDLMECRFWFTEGTPAPVTETETHAMLQQIETPAVSQTSIAPDVLALLWALKIDIAGLANMPFRQTGDAIRERIERGFPATDPVLRRAA